MTLIEAANKNISCVRLAYWGFPNAYLKIDILPSGGIAPVGHYYSKRENECVGMKNPIDIFVVGDTEDRFIEYNGEFDPDDRARADKI